MIMYKKYVKRVFDILISMTLIIGLSWLLILIMLIVRLTSKGPIFFKQKRIGLNKTEFIILKFRTMRIDTPKDLPTHMFSEPEKHITRIGRILRATSLDELPQLFNILKGDMSIVGPRPALWNQYDLIEERDKYKANDVRPGLTGWAQVNGRDELAIPIKAKYDGEYVEQMGFVFDIKCIIKTISCVFSRKGFREGAHETYNKIAS